MMHNTGMAEGIVSAMVRVVGQANPVLVVSAIYLLTSLMTQVLSNNATAVLMTPIVLGLAHQIGLDPNTATVGVDPKPLLMAISFGASASFMTPIGYQTNAIVMGPGGYTFGDYIRFGLPLNILLWIAATFLIPVFYPFT